MMIFRNELLDGLIYQYLYEKQNNNIWQRENSTGYTFALGRLSGACMALGLDYKETETEIVIVTQQRKKVIKNYQK